jgi:hypothetical protein
MSFDALAWAAKQKPGNLAAKMVLLALANYANEAGEAYPSTAAIAEFGDMNHKTATVALDRLEALGMIADTGKKQGKSGQIKVYRLNLQSIPKTEASQKREPPKFSIEDPQKRVTDTVKEPVSSEAKASSEKRAKPSNENWHRLPDGWMPTKPLPAELAAKVAQWPPGKIETELSALHDWAANASNERGKGRKLDWDKAYHGWLRRADEDWRRRNGSGPRPVQQAPDGRAMGRTEAAARQALARFPDGRNQPLGGQAGPATDRRDHGGTLALPDPNRPLRHVAGR